MISGRAYPGLTWQVWRVGRWRKGAGRADPRAAGGVGWYRVRKGRGVGTGGVVLDEPFDSLRHQHAARGWVPWGPVKPISSGAEPHLDVGAPSDIRGNPGPARAGRRRAAPQPTIRVPLGSAC